jgi:branched-chain amino acid transport system permease protein
MMRGSWSEIAKLKFRRALLGLLVALPFLVALPLVLPPYWQSVIVLLTINAILMLGYRLITTMGGWSFAHVAIMGLGAYTTAILTTTHLPQSFVVTLVLGVLLAAAFASIIAYPVLRTRHYYFFLSTFAAGEALRQCYIQFSGITGGGYGISFIPRPKGFWGLDFQSSAHFYYITLFFALLTGVALYRFDLSNAGRTVKAVAANEELSESIGINTWQYRSLAFVTGSAVAGLAGGLYSDFNGSINPLDFSPIFMFKVVAAAMVGGVTTFFGPLLGLLYLTAVEELFREIAEWVPMIWGVSIICVLLFSNGGLEIFLPRFFNRFSSSRSLGKKVDG